MHPPTAPRRYNVSVGDVLKAGEPLVVLESMKMEMKISVPEELDGKEAPGGGRELPVAVEFLLTRLVRHTGARVDLTKTPPGASQCSRGNFAA